MEGRYDYIPANSFAGVVVYDDKLVNAFDMARIHKFGSLDENVEGNEDCVNLPSYKAMEAFVVNEEKVKLQLSKERTEQVKQDIIYTDLK